MAKALNLLMFLLNLSAASITVGSFTIDNWQTVRQNIPEPILSVIVAYQAGREEVLTDETTPTASARCVRGEMCETLAEGGSFVLSFTDIALSLILLTTLYFFARRLFR